MYRNNHLLTVELDGTRYRGAYRIEKRELVVEAHGLGQRTVDASIVDCKHGAPTERLAKLILGQFIKESVDTHQHLLQLAVQGSTTQVALLGNHA